MSHVTKSGQLSVTELKQKLAEAEAARRELLVLALLHYSEDTGEIIRLLISKAAPETLRTLEEMLTTGSEG